MSEPLANAAVRCTDCDSRWYYTRPLCPDCGSEAFEPYELGTGVVESVTVIETTPNGVRSPNPVALVRFEAVSVIAQVESGGGVPDVGDDVEFTGEYVLREDDDSQVVGPRLTRA